MRCVTAMLSTRIIVIRREKLLDIRTLNTLNTFNTFETFETFETFDTFHTLNLKRYYKMPFT